MCGIVGYIGYRCAVDVILQGLQRLEYRGYDSAGIAVRQGNAVRVVKEVGKVAELASRVKEEQIEGHQGIGHTRWATHGGVTQANAHPHTDGEDRITLVHNGIIENYVDLREKLQARGVLFATETDSEVVAKLLSQLLQEGHALQEALVVLQQSLIGSYALVVLDARNPEALYAVRRGSPLVLGLGEGEAFCASDVPALLTYTRKVFYMEDGDMACIRRDGISLYDSTGKEITRKMHSIEWDVSMVEKDGYPHFMLKEIYEQGGVLRATLKDRLQEGRVFLDPELQWDMDLVESWNQIHIVACGTSYYAALAAARNFEKWTDLRVLVEVASEYRYRSIQPDRRTLAVFVSQSGETADTLAAQRKARENGAHCLGITNVRGATLSREVHSILLLKAGPEIGVAATKTFMGQLGVLYLLALYLGACRGTLPEHEERSLVEEFIQLPYRVEKVLARGEEVAEIAKEYSGYADFLYLGRGISYPVALEGALKLKEISYIHAEAYAAGEMKHGPIALLDENVPVMTVIPRDDLYEKTLSNIEEARARKAPILAVGTEGDDLLKKHASHVFHVPWTHSELTPFLTVLPLQLFAYYVALERGCAIDQPRNLAKSVTVE